MEKVYHPETQKLFSSLETVGKKEGKVGYSKADALADGYVFPTTESKTSINFTQKVSRSSLPTENSDGTWSYKWKVTDKTIEETRSDLHAAVRSAYSRAMAPIAAQYPAEEREGWQEQVAAAQEVLAGGQNDLIDALRTPTGETATAMAQNIIAKRQQYLTAYGKVTAARRGLSAQIKAATTLAELDAIDVNAAFGLA